MLKALAGPFPDVAFCPTGGITADTAPQFLALPNVKVVRRLVADAGRRDGAAATGRASRALARDAQRSRAASAWRARSGVAQASRSISSIL